jgi:adenine-specific DNA-methyltransferase
MVALTLERRRKEDGTIVSHLEHHLRQYTARNTRDFFIHKDLRGFLSRELDFYLKNEVLNLEEIEAAGEQLAEGWFQMLRLIKRIGNQIIDFLAQIEDFQKMLWEKKKFVTETFYVITVGNIPEAFYPEIAANDAQWEEWRALGFVEKKPDDPFAFLQAHPTLPLDTRHFSQDFNDRMLASFENLDELTDGLLIHSENWQALNLLQEKYRERLECIYIDPPYNSPSSRIIYKNDYEHSSWLTLMYNRLEVARGLLKGNSGIACAIDDNEYERLRAMMRSLFEELETIAVRSNPAGRSTPKGFSLKHEYVIFAWKEQLQNTGKIPHSKKQEERYKEQDAIGPYEWVNFRKHGGLRDESPKMYYPIFISPSKLSFRIPKMHWDNMSKEWVLEEKPESDEVIVYPDDELGQPRRWKWSIERLVSSIDETKIDFDKNGKPALYIKSRKPQEGVSPSTWWDKKEYSATDWGTRALKDLLGGFGSFDYPKAVDLVIDCIRITNAQESGNILDFFAGSGTTGHAVINLNREDGGRRKFILVEMAHYFDTVLLPRIKKVTFTPEWGDGKPKRMATTEEAERSPRIVKVIRLESYEDALNNLTFDEESGQKALQFFKDDYLLHYMLKWETRKSETFLDVDKLQTPFSYKLRLFRDGETRERPVDLPETFNYLIGLDVETRKAYDDNGRRYLVYRGRLRNGHTAVVIWRETQGWGEGDYKRDADFIGRQKLNADADDVFVNGDSFVPGAQSLDPVFKERMFLKG